MRDRFPAGCRVWVDEGDSVGCTEYIATVVADSGGRYLTVRPDGQDRERRIPRRWVDLLSDRAVW